MKHPITARLIQAWYLPHLTWISALLLPFSYLFQSVVLVRHLCYHLGIFKSYRLPIPVIVVGNISVGGTGKTPCVIALAQYFTAQGYKVGVVSRGYKSQGKQTVERLVDLNSNPIEVGDEPVLIAKRTACPVMICKNRVLAARKLYEEFQCNLILSDDGLQHYALARDIEIIIIDGMRKMGNGYCLPAGPLREPLSRLKTVNFILWNGEKNAICPAAYEMKVEPERFYTLKESTPISLNKDQPIHAIAGIGNPQKFFVTLREMGFTIREHAFPDHYSFRAQDIQFNDDYKVVMTEKDAIKCRSLGQGEESFLMTNAKLPDAFLSELNSLIKRIA